jgi:hypothetical protein
LSDGETSSECKGKISILHTINYMITK